MIPIGEPNPRNWTKNTVRILIKLIEESPINITELAKEHSGNISDTLSSIKTLQKAGISIRKKCVSNQINKNKVYVWYIK